MTDSTTRPAPARYALLTDVTTNRGTVVTTGTEDECRDASTDDRQVVARIDGSVPTGARVPLWRTDGGPLCGLR